VARDDWRIRIELEEEGAAEQFLHRLHMDLGSEARELARDLEARRLAVTHDADTVFVYTSSGLEAEQARSIVDAVLRDEGHTARELIVEHWLEDEDRWDDEPPQPDIDADLLARGYAPWEVRVECESTGKAEELEASLEAQGYSVVRTFRYVVAGTDSEEEARKLAGELHGTVEPGGELVWEVTPQNPFAVFGGLGG
jgi:hypothetical protein